MMRSSNCEISAYRDAGVSKTTEIVVGRKRTDLEAKRFGLS